MRVRLLKRDFTPMIIQPRLEFTVERYSKSVMGGCKTATITVKGDENELWAIINHLRAPVEILSDGGDRKWWGYIKKIKVAASIGYTVDLETMANQIAVAYTNENTRYTTAWVQDADSVAAYGIKELLLARSDATLSDAIGTRDTALALLKTPSNPPEFGDSSEATATIECEGWWTTLDWIYYPCATGKEAFDANGNGGREIGEDDRTILAQSFQIASSTAWAAQTIHLRVWKQGSAVETGVPADNLVVTLRPDSAGVPGATILATAQIAASALGTSAAWYEFTLSVPVTLNPATTYWIHVARSGAVSTTAFYMLDVNTAGGYPRGQIKLWNTGSSSWTDELAAWDLVFRIIGTSENTSQIAPLVTVCGQFFAGVVNNTWSGRSSVPYRDGDTTGLFELIKIMGSGSVNGRRLLAEVTPERVLWINEEAEKPANPTDSYAINRQRILMTSVLAPVPADECLVGIWCHLADVIPPTVDLQLVADPSLFFIDEAEYNASEGTYAILLTRNQSNSMDIGGTVQG